MLCYLVEHAGELVSKDDLIEAVWQTPHVSDMALVSCIRDARRALDDSGQTPEFIQTVRGLGYRFIALLTPVYQRFTEGFETADLIEAKLLLDELDP